MYWYKQVFLGGFLVWGRVPGWWLKSRGGGGGFSCEAPLFKLFRSYIKWSLVLKHVCSGGRGGGNVTFGVYTVPAL